MYLYNVDGVTALLNDIHALPPAAFAQEVQMIETDLKNYALGKFTFDPYQNSTIERVEPGTWLYFGSKLGDALRNGHTIEPVAAASGDCDVEIKITITIKF